MNEPLRFNYIARISTILLVLLPLVGNAQALLNKTTVWAEKENNMFAHFVYGLTVTDKGTILTFAEARIDKSADDGAHHIVMKRSPDKGQSFSSYHLLVESKDGQSWTNPTVVQDRKTKEIFLFYALNHKNVSTQVFYKTSVDDGLSWSAAKEVTSLFAKNSHEWTFHLPGPGHGIQLKKGRLMIPIWHRKSIRFAAAERKYGVNCLYSDDHGKTWKVGGDTPVGELNESQIVEQKNGDVLLIGRTITGLSGSHQAKVWSRDGGLSWTQGLNYDKALTGKVCDIGLVGYGKKVLLVSQPADPGKRKNLMIRMSKDGGETWPYSKLLEEGGATYSDLAVLPDGSVICLYGNGGLDHMPQKVSLARFTLDWLQNNSNSSSKLIQRDADKVEQILKWDTFGNYVEQFNKDDRELIKQYVPNSQANEFLKNNIPYFNCPDKELEKTYYFRWWIYRKHIQQTPEGFVVTEFLPKVPQAGRYNTISCPAAHHFYEGRWLRNPAYLQDYASFWFKGGGSPRSYSFWAANSILEYAKVFQNKGLVKRLLPELVGNYRGWEKTNLCEDGLFWQGDLRDGMEASIGGSGKRASINSYMIGDAKAIAEIAKMAGNAAVEQEFSEKASNLKKQLLTKLWDPQAGFFKTLPLNKEEFAKISIAERYKKSFAVFPADSVKLADVRELHGYTPWYFNIPDEQQSVAWKFLTDTNGFKAPFGPTTAERSHPDFEISYLADPYICQWNGPSWPYATSITLKAFANVLRNYHQSYVSRKDFVELIETYSNSHRHINEKGKKVFFLDENLNPFTGQWLSRVLSLAKRGLHYGEDYNHSEFCDIIISDLIGIQPSMKNETIIDPLIPESYWDWFSLDKVSYHGHDISVVWDKDGRKYNLQRGFSVYVDGVLKHHSKSIERVVINL